MPDAPNSPCDYDQVNAEMVDKKKTGETVGPEETDYQPVNWKKFILSPKYIPFHIIGIVIVVLTALITIYHDEVVDKLKPFSQSVRDLPAGWLIPIVILIVISFPPLFGHEIVALLCGVVYGLWIGFGIVAAGTFLGEIATWFAFKSLLRKKAEKLERTNLNYGAMARMTREGGFLIVLLVRFSAIPTHFSTAVFSTCDVKFRFFAIATFVALPKQIFLVYLGVLLNQSGDNSSGTRINNIIFGVTFVITILVGIYIWIKLRKFKKVLLEEQTQRRADQDALERQKQQLQGSTDALDESHPNNGTFAMNESDGLEMRPQEHGTMYEYPYEIPHHTHRDQRGGWRDQDLYESHEDVHMGKPHEAKSWV